MTQFDDFINRNSINFEKLKLEIYSGFLLTVFHGVYNYLEQKPNKLIFKQTLFNCCNAAAEAVALRNVIREVTNVNLTDDEITQIMKWVKAYLSKSSGRKTASEDIKDNIIDVQMSRCNICGKELSAKNSHLDHIVPFKYVGDELDNNYQYLCSKCNLSKKDNLIFLLKNLKVK